MIHVGLASFLEPTNETFNWTTYTAMIIGWSLKKHALGV
jgi:hypothetical protein